MKGNPEKREEGAEWGAVSGFIREQGMSFKYK
jgi:hypothetical protein